MAATVDEQRGRILYWAGPIACDARVISARRFVHLIDQQHASFRPDTIDEDRLVVGGQLAVSELPADIQRGITFAHQTSDLRRLAGMYRGVPEIERGDTGKYWKWSIPIFFLMYFF